jgi:hypothetical protein
VLAPRASDVHRSPVAHVICAIQVFSAPQVSVATPASVPPSASDAQRLSAIPKALPAPTQATQPSARSPDRRQLVPSAQAVSAVHRPASSQRRSTVSPSKAQACCPARHSASP